MQPFKLKPAFKDYLWGGERLKTVYGKQTPLTPVAESWELSAHPDGPSVIATGENTGMPFDEYVRQNPAACGTRCGAEKAFPVLIKLIDAEKPLSIQVHPEDEYAYRVEGEAGKTEMWVVMEAEPGAFLYFGFAQEIGRVEMRRRIEDNTLTEVLHKAPVNPGDVFFIRAGTIHAIGAGITLAEVQQNSNTTYRVYDYGRVGADGQPRELHLQKALDVTSLCPANMQAPGWQAAKAVQGGELEQLAACEYFTVQRLRLNGAYTGYVDEASFLSVLCTAGSVELLARGEALCLAKGETAFVPAGCGEYVLRGRGEALLTQV